MNNKILTDADCLNARRLASHISVCANEIKDCANTFKYVVTNTDEIKQWIDDSNRKYK